MPERIRRHGFGRLDRAKHHHGHCSRDLFFCQHLIGDELRDQSCVITAHRPAHVGVQLSECFMDLVGHLVAQSECGDRLSECAVPAEHIVYRDFVQPKNIEDRLDRERASHLGPKLSGSSERRRDQLDRVFGDARFEFFANKLRPEGLHKGTAMSLVFGSVEVQHRRAQHTCGGETFVVDGVAVRIEHRLDGKVSPGHEPRAERGHPRHRLLSPHRCERLIRRRGEGRDVERRAYREARRTIHIRALRATQKCC